MAATARHEAVLPDLLASPPSLRLDVRRAREALTFAFAQGVADDTWDELLAEARLPRSKWSPETFAKDLFVRELVESMRDVVVDGTRRKLGRRFLERVLSHPPADRASLDVRRAVLAELADREDARRDLERIHDRLCTLREQLGVPPLRTTDVLRRRLEILGTVRAVLDAMAGAFADARSALASIPAWARAVQASDAHRALVELLDYDDNLATVGLHVRVGADGRVRGLVLTSVKENGASRFARSPLGRLLARLSLWFRGYGLRAEELVARAIEQVFEGLEDAMLVLLQLAGDCEAFLAALAFRENAEKAGLRTCLPEIGRARKLRGLFNPLLLGREKRVVPCDLEEGHDRVLLVTGPNSGGKTRLLQAVGLAQLLGQCGFFVPAAEATLVPVDGMFVSFGQAPSADATEGRLGTELLRVRALFEAICVGGMVLVDELCSGTNPSEGEELFRHVVELLVRVEPQAFLSTHFLTAAADLQARGSERLAFLQVELDRHGLPTHRFVPGVAKTSLAHQTAARLGVTRDDLAALIDRAISAGRGG